MLDSDPAAKSELPENVRSVMEIIINGRDLNAIILPRKPRSSLSEYTGAAADLRGELRRAAGKSFVYLHPDKQPAAAAP